MAEVKRGAENSFTASGTSQLSIGQEKHTNEASGTSNAKLNEQTINPGNTTNPDETENEFIVKEDGDIYPETKTTSFIDNISSATEEDTQMENVIANATSNTKDKSELEELDDKETLHEHIFRQSVEGENPEVYDSNIDALKEAAVLASGIQENKTYVSYWDCGGDDEYHATNHIHLSSDAVYILAFNMTSMISDDGKGFLFTSIILTIHFNDLRWINSVYTSDS